MKAGKPPKEVGFIQNDNNAFRARVQHRQEGAKRDIPGPWRPEEEAAKADLYAMRAAANGMSREDGFAAMKVEADRLKAGKVPKEQGSVKPLGKSFAALIRWTDDEGEERRAYGPRRTEKRRVTGGPPLPGVLSLYPFGVKESPNGTSLAMHPSVGFAFQAKGYVSKERLFLSDATSEALARRLPKICGGIFLSVSL